MTWFFNIAD